MAKIVVIGDIMLDKHVYCDVVGLSPEDDLALKLRIKGQRSRAGGAANVAMNLKSMGCEEVYIFGTIGNDKEGSELSSLLSKKFDGYLIKKPGPTTTKTRYITPRKKHAFRLDNETTEPINKATAQKFFSDIKNISPDIIIVSDYAKGTITWDLMGLIHNLDIKVLVDPKGEDWAKYHKVHVITPNEIEFEKHIGINDAKYTIVTFGGDGCTLAWRDGPVKRLTVREREVGDVTGCGDSFIAGLAMGLLDNDIDKACGYALAAGACAMDHEGVYAVTKQDIEKELETFSYIPEEDI